MNLKHFYYRGYFDGIKLCQPEKGSKERTSNETTNEKSFREKNRRLIETRNISVYSPPNELKGDRWNEIRLRVQNPGLLPGIGYPHEVGYAGEFKLGFGFDHVNGLPVLPGSSVKGVLRSVFPQLEHDPEDPLRIIDKPDAIQKQKVKYIIDLLERLSINIPQDQKTDGGQALVHALELSIFCGWEFDKFLESSSDFVRRPMTKRDIFLDALPVSFSPDKLLGRDALTPHGDNPLKNPIPLPFIKVMPDVVFGFYFQLTDTEIGNVKVNAMHKRRLFAEILCTVGAGAKTNVGYGQFMAENAADRIPKLVKSAAASELIEKSIAPVTNQDARSASTAISKPAKLLPFNKSLKGKKITGEVVRLGVEAVYFSLPEVEGFEGEVDVKVAPSLMGRFEIGKKFEIEVSDVLPDKKRIIAKISNYTAL